MQNKKSKLCCPIPCNKSIKGMSKSQQRDFTARLAKALAHPIRLQILEILKSKKTCICGEIVDELPLAQATVSQHLKVLKDVGLICGTISGPATCYCIDPAVMKEFKTLINDF